MSRLRDDPLRVFDLGPEIQIPPEIVARGIDAVKQWIGEQLAEGKTLANLAQRDAP